MSNLSHVAKISVEQKDSKEQFLYDLDKSKTLCEIVKDICKTSGLPISSVYGLKLIHTNTKNPTVDVYLSDKNYKDVKHNDCLKIVFSIEYLLKDRILPHIGEDWESLEKQIAYDDLMKLSHDSIFIDELEKTGKQHLLIDAYIKDQSLQEKELLALLITICHLLVKGYHDNISIDLLQRTIDIVKNNAKNIVVDHVQYALAILHKILLSKNIEFLSWKEKIIKEVSITCLIPFIRNPNGKKLQYGVLLLINTIIRLCKDDQKRQLIKEMNFTQNRENIYRHIISQGGIDTKMEHELYVVQTYILSLYKEALQSELSLTDNNVFRKEEFELPEDDIRRLTVLLDFDELDSRSDSMRSLLTYHQAERFSLASLASDKSHDSRRSSKVSSPKLKHRSFDFDNITTISYLTLEALRHYKNNHKKNYCQSQIEEKVYEPGIFVTSEKVVKMLAKVLDIGLDPPDHKSVLYQPIVFSTTHKNPFFLELFSRTMWLLSRTRREMKVSTIEDYPKLMKALQKQIEMVLSNRPMNFKTLASDMFDINFSVVLKKWQQEKDEELKAILDSHPCIQELKEIYLKQNEPFVYENRLSILKKGDYFPKVFDKKTMGRMFVQLGKNERELLIYDLPNNKSDNMELKETINIADITHVAIGRNCKHVHLCKSPALVFSIIIESIEKQVNFIAKNETVACCWTDALYIMTGNSRKSDLYTKEIEMLTEMDLRLKLIELQDVCIPKEAPVIPPPPKPLLPPKPEIFAKKDRNSKWIQIETQKRN